jgi:stage V sporulation protein AA
MDKEKAYICVKKKLAIDTTKDIIVGNCAEVFCTSLKLKELIENIKVKDRNIEEDWDRISAIQITELILRKYPNIDLDVLGEPEILLEYKSQENKKPLIEFIKVALVCIVLFLGAGIAIVNFHEDVNTRATMEKLYYTITGEKNEKNLIMTIPYSIGIGVGVITFFTKVLSTSKRRKMEPGPMEIELYLYDQDMEMQIINEVKKNRES